MQPATTPFDVLVVGAGPTGLTAALEAALLGLRVHIVDQRPGRAAHSKALVTHARTMEVFEVLGIAQDIRDHGEVLDAINLHGSFGAHGRVALHDLAWGDTKYPYWLIAPQYDIEAVLEDALAAHGVHVQWNTRFRSCEIRDSHVVSQLTTSDEPAHSITSAWVIGADGGRSTVRDRLGATLDRKASQATFLLADAYTTAQLNDRETHMHLHPNGLLFLIPLPTHGLWRIVAHLPGERVNTPDPVTANQLETLIAERTGLHFGAHNIGWTSRFSPSYGVASPLRSGRIILAGDAAHVHSPVGGQGMNFGIQDAHNLVWKLAVADELQPKFATQLLDSYQAERRPVTTAMVHRVRRLTGLITDPRRTRRRFFGTVGPTVLPRSPARQLLGQTMAGLNIVYRHGPLVVPRDDHSGRRASPRDTSGAPGMWRWVTEPEAKLIRPDGVIAATAPSTTQLHRKIRRHKLLSAVLEAAGQHPDD